ncbi:MAG: MBL fold metallo-hydrolase [Clostridiales Family XIII bacterium]|jgi:glyoxylase-like metal-dependent hydrolase (beta-lactamase superfamily II)|nr:MBL fold metallo-hydrolase [Clostridiales Family XIII bacterium]
MIKIDRVIGGDIEANCWIIHHGDGSEACLIDPGYTYKRYLAVLSEHKLKAKGVLLTHFHYDHAGAADVLAGALDVPVYMHRGDLPYYKGRVDRTLEGGETLDLGGEPIEVFHTPGHSAGGVCFYLPQSKVSFTGDTIFNVDLGYTHFEGGSAADMKASLVSVVNKWGNDVTIYPGHGDPATMKYVRGNNQEFLDMIGG